MRRNITSLAWVHPALSFRNCAEHHKPSGKAIVSATCGGYMIPIRFTPPQSCKAMPSIMNLTAKQSYPQYMWHQICKKRQIYYKFRINYLSLLLYHKPAFLKTHTSKASHIIYADIKSIVSRTPFLQDPLPWRLPPRITIRPNESPASNSKKKYINRTADKISWQRSYLLCRSFLNFLQ